LACCCILTACCYACVSAFGKVAAVCLSTRCGPFACNAWRECAPVFP
jgi:hypothetical protein